MDNNSPVIFEASTWSELAEILPECMRRFKEQGEYNVFGYASIIGSHYDIQPQGSTYHKKNHLAVLPGMEVAMNVYAVGPDEMHGTTDKANGIYNIGLYAGLQTALHEGASAQGLNIRLTEAESRAGITAFILRELGKPPANIDINDLFDPDSGVKEKFSALPQDQFGLYKFQLVTTFEKGKDGRDVAKTAVTVSTNDKNKYAATGLSSIQTAHYILDGIGQTRLSANGQALRGGTALYYFRVNVLESYADYGIEQSLINANKEAVFRLAYAYKKVHEITINNHLSNAEQAEQIDDVITTFGLEGLHTKVFLPEDQVAQRDPLDKIQFKKSIPLTGEEKIGHVAKLFEKRMFDDLGADQIPSR